MLDYLFPKKPKSAAIIDNKLLGKLVWNSECRDWCGEFNGLTLSLGYEKNQLVPSKELIQYTHEIISKPEFLNNCLKNLLENYQK